MVKKNGEYKYATCFWLKEFLSICALGRISRFLLRTLFENVQLAPQIIIMVSLKTGTHDHFFKQLLCSYLI